MQLSVSVCEISPDAHVDQACKKYIDVSRAKHHPHAIIKLVHSGIVMIHVLARQQKDHDDDQADNDVEAPHKYVCELTTNRFNNLI